MTRRTVYGTFELADKNTPNQEIFAQDKAADNNNFIAKVNNAIQLTTFGVFGSTSKKPSIVQKEISHKELFKGIPYEAIPSVPKKA